VQKTASQISDEVLYKLSLDLKTNLVTKGWNKAKGVLGNKKPEYVSKEQLQRSFDNHTSELAKLKKQSAAQPTQEELYELARQHADPHGVGIGPAGGALGGALIGGMFGVPSGSPWLSRVGAGAVGSMIGGAAGRMSEQFVSDAGQVNSKDTGGWTAENAPAFGRLFGGIGGAALGVGLPNNMPWARRLGAGVLGGLTGTALGSAIGSGVGSLNS
jgi:hypothetical protein